MTEIYNAKNSFCPEFVEDISLNNLSNNNLRSYNNLQLPKSYDDKMWYWKFHVQRLPFTVFSSKTNRNF